MTQSEIPLLLFAKAPIPGRVKTRLQTHCSAEHAASIAEVLLEESIIKATLCWPGRVYLSVALDAEHTFLQKMLSLYPVTLVEQCEGDLGSKMQGAFTDFGYPAAIMGCDAPHILGSDLIRAHTLLSSGQSVLGPSDDGGYYLIGLAESQDVLFHNVEWGTERVLGVTLTRAQQSNLVFQMLEPLNDVDEWDDLKQVAKKLPTLSALL